MQFFLDIVLSGTFVANSVGWNKWRSSLCVRIHAGVNSRHWTATTT